VLKRLAVFVAAFVIGIFVVTGARADFEAGVRAYDAGDYAAAIVEWRPLAEQGHLEAQFGMGIIYENGRGIGRDYNEAAKWYTAAAEGGHPGAQFNLGNMYQQGLGVEKDPSKAVYWWTLAAAQGLSEAQLNLGIAYHRGNGVAPDQDEALIWFVRSAEAGNAMGQFSAGYAYETGLGTEPDRAVARRYYTQAAEAGVQQATTRLAEMGPPTEEELAVDDVVEETVTVETVETVEPVETVEAVETVETVESENVAVVETTVEEVAVPEPATESQEPASTAVDYSAASQSSSEATAATEPSAPAGNGPYIQIAAYLSNNRAEDAWTSLTGKYPDILGGLPHRVLMVELGGELGTVYRLQAGPMPAQSEAQATCNQLKQRGGDCFLVAP
jgi:uncharacterized protein